MIGELWNSIWLMPAHAVLITAAVLLGRGLARWEEKRLGGARQCRVGPFERAVGTLMAFLIGFTFALTSGDFRDAQASLHRKSDAIAEANRWSHLLSGTDRKRLQDNLRVYVNVLIRRDTNLMSHRESEAIDQEIQLEQVKLWEGLAGRRSGATERTPYDACLRAVNQSIQVHYLGYYIDRRRLPAVMVLFILGGTMLISFLVGYTSELQGRHFAVMACLFILFITATVYLIWEMNRPNVGLFNIDRQHLIDLAGRLWGYPP